MAELVNPRAKETVSKRQFREIYKDVERIFALTDAADLMSLGPTIVDREAAVEDGWLDSVEDFEPMLRATTVPGIEVSLDGATYTAASLFFKRGGNHSAGKEWLGDVRFTSDDAEFEFKIHTDGRIKMTKRSQDSRWVSTCWAQEEDKSTLSDALNNIKVELHKRKIGDLALR